jgi:hypothetical protein
MKQSFNNDSPQPVRRAVIENDQRVHKNTYFSHAHPDEGGRFAVSDQAPRHVVGSTPVPRYPALPGSLWGNQAAAVPPEEPLGVDVNAVEPAGTHAEIEKSIEKSLAESRGGEGVKLPPTSPPSERPNGELLCSDAGRRSGVVETSSPHLTKRKGCRHASK